MQVSLASSSACRFWDQLNSDVGYLSKRYFGFSPEVSHADAIKPLPDLYLRQLVSGHAKASKEVHTREKELWADASDVEKALTHRSAQLQQALSHLVDLTSQGETCCC